MNGPSGRSLSRWISRASSSLPVPLSPSISTVADSFAILLDDLDHLAHRAARARRRTRGRSVGHLGAEREHLAVQILVLAGVPNDGQQLVVVDVLGEEVIRAHASSPARRSRRRPSADVMMTSISA